MGEVTSGGALMYSWLSLRERITADLKRATGELERSEQSERKSPRRAAQAYERGVRVLLTYPLDPETLSQWSREILNESQGSRDLQRVERFRKIDRVLRKSVEALEKERDRLVLPNLRLVLKEVFRYHPTGMRRSDLFQEGILGLQKAVFRFDPERGIRFSTYATYWIRQSIRKSLIDKSRMIRVPQAVQEELRKAETKLKATERARVQRIMSDTVLFSYGESDGSDDRFSFDVNDPTAAFAGEGLHTREVPRAVSDALRDLNQRERDVLQRRFGLAGERPQTLEEIGSHLNLSRERIRQIQQKAMARMRGSQDLVEVYEDLSVAGGPVGVSRS
jgi:RNA polymerase sigma factor (sigma-70 family)